MTDGDRLRRDIREIATSLTTAVLRQRPCDVVTFCAAHLAERLRQRDARLPPHPPPLRRHESVIKAELSVVSRSASVGVTTGMQQFDPLRSQVMVPAAGGSAGDAGRVAASCVLDASCVELVGHAAAVTQCHVAAAASYVITSSLDASLAVWDLTSGARILSLPTPSPVTDFTVVRPHPARLIVLAAGDDGRVTVWRVRFGARKLRAKLIMTLNCNLPNPIAAIATSPDRRRFATGCCFVMHQISLRRTRELSVRGTLKTWDLEKIVAFAAKQSAQKGEQRGDFRHVALRTMRQLVATSTLQRKTSYDKLSGDGWADDTSYGVRAICYTPDSARIVVAFGHPADVGGEDDKMVVVCTADTLATLWVDSRSRYHVNGLRFTRGGSGTAQAPWQLIIFTQYELNKVNVYAKDGSPPRFAVHSVWDRTFTSPHSGGCVSNDGHLVASAVGADVVVRNAATGAEITTLTGHRAAVTRMAFSDDDAYLCTVARDNAARVWKLRTGDFATATRAAVTESLLGDGRHSAAESVDSDADRIVAAAAAATACGNAAAVFGKRRQMLKKRYSVLLPVSGQAELRCAAEHDSAATTT